MTTRIFVLCVFVTSMSAGAGLHEGKGLAMSPGFSAAATEMVRAVDSYQGVTDVGIPEISDAMAAVSTRAHTQGEQQAMKALRTFLEDKMDNNGLRAELIAKAESGWQKKHVSAGPADDEVAAVRQEALEQPGVREMTHREDDCAAELRQIFEMKSYRAPARCSDVRIRHDEHAMQQYFPQTPGS